MEALSDEQLVERYRAEAHSLAGQGLLNQLFERHQARVAAWCYRMTGDVDRAADLAQEVFLKAFQRLDAFRGDSRFATWLYSIARNHCMDELRSRAERPEEKAEDMLEEMADLRAETIPASLERRQAESAVRQLMRETLDDTEARAMTLHYVHELPLDAVTRILKLTNRSGAKAYIVSARRKLTKGFARWSEGSQA